jgi:hypothetical protein
MLYPMLASIIVWGALLFGLRLCLARWKPPGWAYKTITATAGTAAVLSVVGVGFYAGMRHLLAEGSILWTLS